MEKKENVLSVICETEEIAKHYNELAIKMSADKVFIENCNSCSSLQELYRVYKDFGYTDMEFEDFEKVAGEDFQHFAEANAEGKELTTEELESVVGGINLMKYVKSAINCIPVLGPYITGSAKEVEKIPYSDLSGGALALEICKDKACEVLDNLACCASMDSSWFVRVCIPKGTDFLKYAIRLVEW